LSFLFLSELHSLALFFFPSVTTLSIISAFVFLQMYVFPFTSYLCSEESSLSIFLIIRISSLIYVIYVHIYRLLSDNWSLYKDYCFVSFLEVQNYRIFIKPLKNSYLIIKMLLTYVNLFTLEKAEFCYV
jgi:hypothetical protein